MKISLWNREKVTIELFRKQFTMLRGNFYEKSLTLNAVMFVTDTNDVVYSYIITIKDIKFKANNFSKKLYNNGSWKLELYSLELPYQTKIGIEKLQD